jgi:hypothetical protein
VTTTATPLRSDPKGIDMAVQSENERNSVVAEDGHVVAVFNIGVPRTDAVALKQIELQKDGDQWLTW